MDCSGFSWRNYFAAFTFLAVLHPVLTRAAAYCACRRLDKTRIISSLTVSLNEGQDAVISSYYHLCSCSLKNGYEAIFFRNICTRIYNENHFLSAPTAVIAQRLKRIHKVGYGWADRESRTDCKIQLMGRENSLSLNGDIWACFICEATYCALIWERPLATYMIIYLSGTKSKDRIWKMSTSLIALLVVSKVFCNPYHKQEKEMTEHNVILWQVTISIHTPPGQKSHK